MSAQIENFSPVGQPRGSLLAADDLVRFNYRGRTIRGDAAAYYIYAHDEADARRQLEEARLVIEEITRPIERGRRSRRFTRQDLGSFCLQLADRVRSGEPITTAVIEIGRATRHHLLREALYEIAAELRREGARPADAFRLRPDLFPRAFVNVVQIGAKKGDISDMLTRYGRSQLQTAENLSRFRGALYYPATIMALAVVIIAVMCCFILPRMEDFYASLLPLSQGELPFMTRGLIGLSRALTSWFGLIGVVSTVAGALSLARWAGAEGRETLERLSLRLPGAGPLLRAFHAAYHIHLISILVGAGVTPTEFLREAAESSMNVVYREKLEAIREAFHEGGLELQTAFAPFAFLFGDEFQATLATGERTGRLDTQLEAYAQLLDRRVQESITRVSKLIEPLTLVVAGVVIGLIVIAAYLPLFTLIGQMSGAR